MGFFIPHPHPLPANKRKQSKTKQTSCPSFFLSWCRVCRWFFITQTSSRRVILNSIFSCAKDSVEFSLVMSYTCSILLVSLPSPYPGPLLWSWIMMADFPSSTLASLQSFLKGCISPTSLQLKILLVPVAGVPKSQLSDSVTIMWGASLKQLHVVGPHNNTVRSMLLFLVYR